ncbi:hypothetical protein QFZ24_000581 [Streptomyces phaeochromogenes]|jgi:hypothetical protein|uniref:hypothetical protein n=2 Tax=Streptomyces TaxID=1883 RepID=UPI0027936EBF|nr:hypothetical protein [Streptomyces sp. NBC_00258]MDQ0946658.1 hypothetical protein [Streptomyces phaeochromogenes]
MIFAFPVLCIFAWMAWSVFRMSHLHPWRQWLPATLLTTAVSSWFLLAASGASELWVYLPICLALASWAVSLRERRAAGSRERLGEPD